MTVDPAMLLLALTKAGSTAKAGEIELTRHMDTFCELGDSGSRSR